MSPAVLLVVAGLAAGTWLLWDLRPPGPAGPGAASAAARSSVIIPARNEAAALPRLLASLAAQPHPPAEVIVVDDESTDGTPEVAAAFGAVVISALPRPGPWLGKPWACQIGAGIATGDRLVFLDADTELAPDGLARLLHAHAAQVGDGLLSVQPFHVTERPHEQLSAVANAVSMMASGAFRPGAGVAQTVAFGPCLVTDALAYGHTGGHASVAGEVIEDIHLARAYRGAGLPVRALAGGSTVSFRMYPQGVSQLAEGWTKNLAGGPRLAPPGPTLGAVLWVAAALAVAIGAVRVAFGAAGPTAVPLIVAGWLAFTAQLAWMLRRIGSFRWWTVVAFPIPLAAFVALFARSGLRRVVRRQVMWRGRAIDLGPARH